MSREETGSEGRRVCVSDDSTEEVVVVVAQEEEEEEGVVVVIGREGVGKREGG